MKFETKVIHAGQAPDPRTGAVMTPIYATSTYAQSSPGEHKGYDYARTRNPTRDALEACLASEEPTETPVQGICDGGVPQEVCDALADRGSGVGGRRAAGDRAGDPGSATAAGRDRYANGLPATGDQHR